MRTTQTTKNNKQTTIRYYLFYKDIISIFIVVNCPIFIIICCVFVALKFYMNSKTTVSYSPKIQLRKKKTKFGFSLYLDINYNGKRKYEFLNLYLTGNKDVDNNTLELAERIKSKKIITLQNAEHGEIDRNLEKDDFLTYFENIAKSKYKNWGTALFHLRSYHNKKLPFNQITPLWLEGFKAFLLSRLKRNSASTYLSRVKQALKLAVRDDIILRNPFDKIDSINKKQTPRTFLSLSEIIQLDNTEFSHPEVKRAFLFACFSGLRISDIKKLTWDMFKDGNLEFIQKKTQEPVILPLSNQALKYLGERAEGLIFKLPVYVHIQKLIVKFGIKAGLSKHLTFHVSRHTFATLSITYGIDIYTVSKLLGHSDIKNTQIYAKLVDQKKREAVEKLPSF